MCLSSVMLARSIGLSDFHKLSAKIKHNDEYTMHGDAVQCDVLHIEFLEEMRPCY